MLVEFKILEQISGIPNWRVVPLGEKKSIGWVQWNPKLNRYQFQRAGRITISNETMAQITAFADTQTGHRLRPTIQRSEPEPDTSSAGFSS